MTGRERFPFYVDLQDRLGRWPGGRTFREQRELVAALLSTVFTTWDEQERLKDLLLKERDPDHPGSLAYQLREATRRGAAA